MKKITLDTKDAFSLLFRKVTNFAERDDGELSVPSLEVSVMIAPNPVYNFLTINANDVIIDAIQIIDMNGKSIISEIWNTEKGVLNVSNLNDGVYFIKILSNKGCDTKILLKTKQILFVNFVRV